MSALLLALRPLLPYLLCVLVGIGATLGVDSWRYGARIAHMQTAAAEQETAAVQDALRTVNRWQGALNDALTKSQARAAVLARSAAGARAAADGLHGQLADLQARADRATRAAVSEYAITATGLLDECSRRYSELAGKADGHANDVRTFTDAWPK